MSKIAPDTTAQTGRHPRPELVRLDHQLALLGRGLGAQRLRLGEALQAFFAQSGHFDLGFSSFAGYAHERCGRSGRWADDSRAVARRLAHLPELRAALIQGHLSWSMTELLARRATPDTEAELIATARTSTVRAMRQALTDVAPADSASEPDPEEPPRRLSLQITVDRPTALFFEATKTLVRHLDHCPTNEDVIECMLFEGMSTLFHIDPAAPHEHGLQADREMTQAWREQLDARRREAEEACESSIDTGLDEADYEAEPEPDLPTTRAALDDHIVHLAEELAHRDLLFGDLARRFWESDGWRSLGYASAFQYARERVGLSHSSIGQRIRLSRRTARLPAVADALIERRIGFEAANLVARVAAATTVEGWLDRATQRTVKHLREEVEMAETLTRISGDTRWMVPPDDETIAYYKGWEIDTLSAGPMLRASQMSGGPEDGEAADGAADDDDDTSQMSGGPEDGEAADGAADDDDDTSQMSGGPFKPSSDGEPRLRRGGGKVSYRFNLEEDVYWMWRQCEADWRRLGRAGSFLRFLCDAMWETWRAALLLDEAWKGTFLRDGYECTNPVCTSRRNLNAHHIKHRSKGGGDEESNLLSVCATCHLFGIHEGRLAVEPPAHDPTWLLGADRWLIIRGRRKLVPTEGCGDCRG